ncbi:MAG TPA: CPBP family intramembrane glutamic endopeptidase [Thermoplasmata archaeon]|nr:CPBP family intramembrane glutamic endopeptidase [Thermoplasmata archaeon]
MALTAFAILSQYFLPRLVPSLRPIYGNLSGDLLIVYGLPILGFALLVGTNPLARFARSMGKATVEGLRWYGILSLASLVLTVFVAIAYLALDPSALSRLNAPNPDLKAAAGDPWLWVGLSFAIGLVEETIFRGWIFGFWLARRSPRWLPHAIWTSALFVGVHFYYVTTYGAAAGVVFPTLFLLGLAFAVAMRFSGGNLVVIGLLHGAYDAAAFLTIVSFGAGAAFRFGLIGVGVLVAGVVYVRRARPEASGPSPLP